MTFFRSMLATPPPDSAHPLAVALSSNQPRLGYFYLNYLSRHTTDGSLEHYSTFAEIFEDLSLRECLVKDLKVSCATYFLYSYQVCYRYIKGNMYMYLCMSHSWKFLYTILPCTLLHDIIMQTFFFFIPLSLPYSLSLSAAYFSLVVYIHVGMR